MSKDLNSKCSYVYFMVKPQEIKNAILKKFFFNEKLKYNEIWDKKICSSSNFDYHLKKLIEDEILKKEGEFYVLTVEGNKLVTTLDSSSMTDKKKPVVCAFILVYDKEENKILFSVRKKQPYMEHLNIPGGKVEIGVFSDVEARRELKEETGLECENIDLKLITEKITYNEIKGENKVEHHIVGYFYLGTNYSGELLNKTYEGDNIWIKPEELSNFKRFPDLDFIVPYMINENKIKIVKIDRFRKDGKFVDLKIDEIN